MTGDYVVAGGIGYTGTYIVRHLLAERDTRITVLTNHPDRKHEFGGRIRIRPYNFDNPAELKQTMREASCVINTYWSKPINVTKVRLNYRTSTFSDAVKNSKLLVDACVDAGVKRLVHISVSNPSRDYDY
ncbi:NAD-dependent epimerase/dehydratase, partial [mine drainage metagenome]